MTSIVIFNLGDFMRGARLLQTLLLLQNRGRLTSAELAQELEVSRRTVLRDLDAMTEAGLPIIVFQGSGGGIELGFDYRSQLTALTTDEAEALAILLANPHPGLEPLGLAQSARRAAGKITEAQATPVRQTMAKAIAQFDLKSPDLPTEDIRISALARAIRNRNLVTLNARSSEPRQVMPCALQFDGKDWHLHVQTEKTDIPQSQWGDLVISNKSTQ